LRSRRTDSCCFSIVLYFASHYLHGSLSDCCSERSLLFILGYHPLQPHLQEYQACTATRRAQINTSSGQPGMGSFSDGSMFILGEERLAPGTTRAGALQFGASTQGQSISMASMGLKGTDRDARSWLPADLLEDGSWFVSKTSN
jgi:hypothetical protein